MHVPCADCTPKRDLSPPSSSLWEVEGGREYQYIFLYVLPTHFRKKTKIKKQTKPNDIFIISGLQCGAARVQHVPPEGDAVSGRRREADRRCG